MTSGQAPDPLEFELSFSQALARAARVRCPYCGIGRLFGGLIRMNSTCAECGTRFEREPGYFLGSTYINYGVTAGLTTVTYVVLHFGFGWPNQVLMPALMSFCLVFPLVFFRYARSLWLTFDCFFDRLGARQVIMASQQSESPGEVPNNGA